MNEFIVCENLVKIYRIGDVEVQALQGLDINIARGELLGIVGASGSGKSTLLNVLGGLDRPTGGRAYVGGRDLLAMKSHQLDEYRRSQVGFVWQMAARNLIPYLTALENVELPLILSGMGGKLARQRATDLLTLVGLPERKTHYLHQLSGGEAQRVGIAIALVNNPELVLADEPTGEVDTATASSLYGLFEHINRELGVTIIIVSHDPNIARHVNRVVAVRDGKLASETIRKTDPRNSDSGESGEISYHEVVLLDSAGRLQIPPEHLERLGIRRRAQLDLTPEGILIRPVEEVAPTQHQHDAVTSPEKPASTGVTQRRTWRVPGWPWTRQKKDPRA